MKYRIKSLYDNKLAFFSGTDRNTLKNEGSDCNNFLSLIVNNAGQYEAAITRKVTTSNSIYKRTVSKGEYSLFNTDNKVELPEEISESNHTESTVTVEYFPLTIEKNNNIFANPECEAFSKVLTKEEKPAYKGYPSRGNNVDYGKTYWPKDDDDDDGYYGSLFKEYGIESKNTTPKTSAAERSNELSVDEKAILEEQATKINWNKTEYLLFMERLFFGTPFITTPKCKDFKSEVDYIVKNFNNACSKTFGNTEEMRAWFESSMDYYLFETAFPAEKTTLEYDEYFEDCAIVAYRIIKALEPYNKYPYIAKALVLLKSRII